MGIDPELYLKEEVERDEEEDKEDFDQIKHQLKNINSFNNRLDTSYGSKVHTVFLDLSDGNSNLSKPFFFVFDLINGSSLFLA